MVAFDPLLDRFARFVRDGREGGGQRRGVGGRAIGRRLARDDAGGRDRPVDAVRRVGRRTPQAHVDIDHLAVPVDGPVDVGRLAGDPRVGLIDAPA